MFMLRWVVKQNPSHVLVDQIFDMFIDFSNLIQVGNILPKKYVEKRI